MQSFRRAPLNAVPHNHRFVSVGPISRSQRLSRTSPFYVALRVFATYNVSLLNHPFTLPISSSNALSNQLLPRHPDSRTSVSRPFHQSNPPNNHHTMASTVPMPPTSAQPGATSNPASSILASLRSLTSATSVATALTSSIPSLSPQAENAKLQVSALWTSAKPWSEFFNGKKFVPPSSPSELQERLVDNLTYFSSNYVLCFLVLSTASVLIHPLSFLCVLILAGLYVFLFLQNHDSVKIGPIRLSSNTKMAAFGLISFVLLYATNAIGIIGSWALFGVILSLLHAGCRVSAKEPDFDSPVNSV